MALEEPRRERSPNMRRKPGGHLQRLSQAARLQGKQFSFIPESRPNPVPPLHDPIGALRCVALPCLPTSPPGWPDPGPQQSRPGDPPRSRSPAPSAPARPPPPASPRHKCSPGKESPRSSWFWRCGCRRPGRCCCSWRSPWLSPGLAGRPGCVAPRQLESAAASAQRRIHRRLPSRGPIYLQHPMCTAAAGLPGTEGSGEGGSGGAQHLPSCAAARAGRSSRGCTPRLPVLSSDNGCGEPGRRAGRERAKEQLPIAKPPAAANHPPPLPRPAGEGLSRVAAGRGDTRGGAEGAGYWPFVMSSRRRPGSLCGRKREGVPGGARRERMPLGVR